MTGLFTVVAGFFEDVFTAIANLVTWIGELAETLNDIELSTSGITLIMGNFRYLAGDTLYLIFISTFYIGVFMIAFKTIPIVVSWWKHFLPT
jgi:hypothetical protein